MKKETLFIAFSTQKGGIGKTTLTVLAASYLHYVRGFNVAVVDCDYPQYSIVDMRERDIEQVTGDDYYKRLAHIQFTALMSEPLIFVILLIFMMSANINHTNHFNQFKISGSDDYIFVPVSADRVVLESTLRFATLLNDNLITTGKSNIKALHLIWNMVDGREKTELYHAYDNAIAELGLQIMKTVIPDSKRFRKEMSEMHRPVFRSTIFPLDRNLAKGSNVEELVNEICKIVKQ